MCPRVHVLGPSWASASSLAPLSAPAPPDFGPCARGAEGTRLHAGPAPRPLGPNWQVEHTLPSAAGGGRTDLPQTEGAAAGPRPPHSPTPPARRQPPEPSSGSARRTVRAGERLRAGHRPIA